MLVLKKWFAIIALLCVFNYASSVNANELNPYHFTDEEYQYVKLFDMSDYQFAFVGNIKTMKLHVPGCRYAAKTEYKNLIGFGSRNSAILLGFSPCKVCRP